MSMKKWTDEELIATRDNMEALKKRQENGANSKLGLLTALIGALAISTGVAFIFLDGYFEYHFDHNGRHYMRIMV